MITYNYSFRALYADTDQMGAMHHVNYVRYCEIARWELFRSIGVPYKHIEDAGVMCPVVDMYFKFVKPTYYDALITVKTTLRKIKGVRMWFDYEFYNEAGELINKAETQISFVRRDNWRPCSPPDFVWKAIEKRQTDE